MDSKYKNWIRHVKTEPSAATNANAMLEDVQVANDVMRYQAILSNSESNVNINVFNVGEYATR